MSNSSSNAKKTMQTILIQLSDKINIAKVKNNGKFPYGYVSKIISELRGVFPWLNCDLLNNHMRWRGEGKRGVIVDCQKNIALVSYEESCSSPQSPSLLSSSSPSSSSSSSPHPASGESSPQPSCSTSSSSEPSCPPLNQYLGCQRGPPSRSKSWQK